MIENIQSMPEYVPCMDCAMFSVETEACDLYKTKTDPYIQVYGCGEGELDIPF